MDPVLLPECLCQLQGGKIELLLCAENYFSKFLHINISLTHRLICHNVNSGELRAHLITPLHAAPVDTLEDILESGLRWEMVLYGDPAQDYMAETDDPVIKAIWEGKNVVEFSSVLKEGEIL